MSNEELNPKMDGPESAPLRDYIKTLPVVVTVYDMKGSVVKHEKFDYGNADHRRWLGKLTFWALSNHYSVETMMLEDYRE